jgi:hypothetical protein
MQKTNPHPLLALAAVLLVASANADTITLIDHAPGDGYWGAEPGIYNGSTGVPYPYPNQITIGAMSEFGISGMVVEVSGSTMTVTIDTPYQDGTDGTHDGNLLISTTGWNPNTGCGGAPHYACDNLASTASQWNFAVVQGANSGAGAATLESISNATLETSNQAYGASATPVGGWIYRIDQPVLAGANGIALASGASGYDFTNAGADLVYTVDLNALAAADGGALTELGLSWAMTCANSIVQGEVTVAEPATLGLLGLGLAVLGLIRRRR